MTMENISPRLVALGWTASRARAAHASLVDALQPARVLAQHRDRYVVATADSDCSATIPGRARAEAATALALPAVGDWVAIRQQDADLAVIVELLPRTSAFVRQSAGNSTTPQVLAANIELALIATAIVGDLNPRRIERYAILAWESGATPVVLLTKCDLAEPEEVAAARAVVAYAAPGVETVVLSTHTGAGMHELERMRAPGTTAVILGSSGVGKSTLVNALLGDEHLRTSETGSRGKGRHTTTHRELVRLGSGALLIDTPGMRELQLWSDGSGVAAAFTDIESLATGCRFRDCGHEVEPGCAVRDAVDAGELEPDRLESYRSLRREVAWLERRTDALAAAEAKRRVKVIHRAMHAPSWHGKK